MIVDKPVLVIGGGGHAKVLINCLLLTQKNILGILEQDPCKIGQVTLGVPVIGTDDVVFTYKPNEILLVNGLGSTGLTTIRTKIFGRFKDRGYSFASVVHPSAVISANVMLGEGVQIMAGAIIQPGCCIGADSIINTRASVDHDCCIGEHVHIAPGVILSGGVTIKPQTHLGTGVIVIQNIEIGSGCVVSAGAVVTRNVRSGVKVQGVPAIER